MTPGKQQFWNVPEKRDTSESRHQILRNEWTSRTESSVFLSLKNLNIDGQWVDLVYLINSMELWTWKNISLSNYTKKVNSPEQVQNEKFEAVLHNTSNVNERWKRNMEPFLQLFSPHKYKKRRKHEKKLKNLEERKRKMKAAGLHLSMSGCNRREQLAEAYKTLLVYYSYITWRRHIVPLGAEFKNSRLLAHFKRNVFFILLFLLFVLFCMKRFHLVGFKVFLCS